MPSFHPLCALVPHENSPETLPAEAVEAAVAYLPGIPTDNRERQLRRYTAQAMLEAAMPHIRRHIAEEIADEYGRINSDTFNPSSQEAAFIDGIDRAIAVVRLEAPHA